jgi:chemotaxis protein CheX
MSDQILVSFSDATRDTLKLMLDLEATAGQPAVSEETGEQLRVAIEITGDIQGVVYYRFPSKTVIEIVKIMSGMEIGEIDDFVSSAIGEIANIISGNAMNSLYEKKFVCDIKPPQITMDKPSAECTDTGSGTQVVTDIGVFNLDLFKK